MGQRNQATAAFGIPGGKTDPSGWHGTITLEEPEQGVLLGTLEGRLATYGGVDVGTLSGTFTARWLDCRASTRGTALPDASLGRAEAR